jgi:ADP-ribosylglycohydrolase
VLLELAVGDAYGAGFEYANPAVINAHNDLSHYIQHPRHQTPPGCYTDDTQMSLAIAEAIISGEPWTPERLADRFVTTFRRDPREGYAARFHAFLTQVSDGQQFLAEIDPTSDKSGAAMRATPIGVFPSIEEVVEKTRIQATITHNTFDGINAAVAAALMSHYFLYQLGPKRELGWFIEQHLPGQWAEPWHGKVKAQGWMSVRAAITALLEKDHMTTLLQRCIQFSGDVDTVATIALAAGACCVEMIQDLPENLIRHLENGDFGRDYIVALDQRLMSCVDRT